MEVGGEGVVVVPACDFRRVAEPAAIVGDDSVAGGEQCAGLALPAVPIEGVPMDEYDRLTGSLIFVGELDGSAVLVSDDDACHDLFPFRIGAATLAGWRRGVRR